MIKRAEIADIFGVSPRTVKRWCEHADFPPPMNPGARGLQYRSETVVRWFVDHELRQRLGQVAPGDGLAPDEEVAGLTAERAALAREQRLKLERENAVARGELVPAGTAHRVLAASIGSARSILLRVHASVAQTLPDLPTEVVEVIRQQHHDALQALSETPLPGHEAEAEP